MKKIRLVELIANIKVNLVAFLSISMFVALGVGLFLGIQWGATALQKASQEVLEQGNMHDIEVQFPYGITESDLAQIRAVEGVEDVEVGYSTYVSMQRSSTNYTFKLQTPTTRMNQPTSIEGRMPAAKGEAALLKSWCAEHDIKIGDVLKLKHDADGVSVDENGNKVEDKDGMSMLSTDTLTVTGIVEMPTYISKMENTFGVSNIASGAVNCVAIVSQDTFDTSKYNDGYPNVYMRCSGLEGLSTFSKEYDEKLAPITDRITELGGKLAPVRYNKVHGDLQSKLDEAQDKIDDGQRQLDEGRQKIADGEKALADGQRELDNGRRTLVDSVLSASDEQGVAQEQLDEAYRLLADGQGKYDAGVATYNTVSDLYNQLNSEFNSISGEYYELLSLADTLSSLGDSLSSEADETEETAKSGDDAATSSKLNDLLGTYNEADSTMNRYGDLLSGVTGILGSSTSIGGLSDLSGMSLSDVGSIVSTAREAVGTISDAVDKLTSTSVTVGDITIRLDDIPGGLDQVADYLDDTRAELESSEQELNDGWAQYYAAKAEYDGAVASGQADLRSGSKKLDDGSAELRDKTKELEDGKTELADKTKELEDGKADLQSAKDKFAEMVEYEWVVMPRRDNGGVQQVKTMSYMINNVSWAMALLFILVGLFVAYSAISRLVHEESIQIGTKKALGFRKGEVAAMYFGFSGLSVLLGVLISILIAVFLVQGIMNPIAARQFSMPEFGPHFDIVGLLILGGIELVLILLSTWIAINGLLKKHAVELLKGESTANVKEHFYEKWAIWDKMSLFSQTVVNNCVNDTRRVVGTLIGVIGCTALIVTAVTLNSNVSRSLDRHYEKVYNFDTVAYLTKPGEENSKSVAMALYDHGVDSAPAIMKQLQVRQSNGARLVSNMVVPTNDEAFKKYYHVNNMDGGEPANLDEGVWMTAAYAEHMGAKVGDEVTFTEFTGKTHTFKIAGFYDYYLLRSEFVMTKETYEKAFNEEAKPNVLLVNRGDADIDTLQDQLFSVDGYQALVDDFKTATYAYDELKEILTTVVLIYLLLSALMALMVLLNLDVMFVDEKKKELIVLMICGFSTKDAKAYIYRDSIALTIIGILLGVLLGAIMGGITVWALEPESGYFIKGFNEVAALVGIIGAGVFAAAVLIWSLRRIPKFDLTDINRF